LGFATPTTSWRVAGSAFRQADAEPVARRSSASPARRDRGPPDVPPAEAAEERLTIGPRRAGSWRRN